MGDDNHKKLTIISATTLQRESGTIIRRAAKDREGFLVERDGIPVVVVLSVAEYEALTGKPLS